MDAHDDSGLQQEKIGTFGVALSFIFINRLRNVIFIWVRVLVSKDTAVLRRRRMGTNSWFS